MISHLPSIEVDGLALGSVEATSAGPRLIRILTTNQPTMTAQNVKRIGHRIKRLQSRRILIRLRSSWTFNSARGSIAGDLFIDGSRGWFDFEAESATFSLPEIFPQPWAGQALSGTLVFNRTDDGLLLRGQSLRVASDVQDVRGTLLLDLPRETEQLIQLELTVNASKDALADLLPHALDAELSDFLTRAIEDVEVHQGRISYSGPLGTDVDRSRRELSMSFPMT